MSILMPGSDDDKDAVLEAESDVIVTAVILGFCVARAVQGEPFSFDVEAAATQMLVGRTYDRLGGLRIASFSVLAMAVLMVVIAIPGSALVLAVVFIVGTPAISGQYAVAFPLATTGADSVDLPHGIVLGAINVCWGLGFFVGPALGAAIAQASSDRVSYLLAAGVSALALPALRFLALQPTECQEPA